MKKNRTISLLLTLIMLAALCIGGQTSAFAMEKAAEGEEITITDMIGREVTITPGSYQRVACIGAGALRMYSYIGDVGLLCGVEDIDNTSLEERPKMFDSVARPYMLAFGKSFTELPSCGVGGPQAQTAEAEKILACDPDIVISEYEDVEKEDALQEQKEFMGDKGYLLNGLEDDNPLPASYRIKVDSLEYLGYVVDELKMYNGVETISAPTDLAKTLTGVEKAFLILGSIIIGILIVSSAVVISNTIRLTLYARRREIMIMKYVGATDSFIRLPFVVEGITIGIVSALLAFGVLSLIYESLGTMFGGSGISWLTGVSSQLIPFSRLWKAVLGSFVGFGVVLGAFGSGSSIRRYLRV